MQNILLLQWNANSVKNKLSYLIKFMYDNNIDVALLQETFFKDENEIKVKGYNKIITK